MTLINKFTLAGIALVAFTGYTWAAAVSDTFTIRVYTEVTAPTCSITVPPTYDLKNMVRGLRVEHSPFNVSWNCSGWNTEAYKNTYLTARAVNNNLTSDDNWMYFFNKKDNSSNTAMLSLKAGGKHIKLNDDEKFCVTDSGSGMCSITPVTDIPKTAKPGEVMATVNLSVSYQ